MPMPYPVHHHTGCQGVVGTSHPLGHLQPAATLVIHRLLFVTRQGSWENPGNLLSQGQVIAPQMDFEVGGFAILGSHGHRLGRNQLFGCVHRLPQNLQVGLDRFRKQAVSILHGNEWTLFVFQKFADLGLVGLFSFLFPVEPGQPRFYQTWRYTGFPGGVRHCEGDCRQFAWFQVFAWDQRDFVQMRDWSVAFHLERVLAMGQRHPGLQAPSLGFRSPRASDSANCITLQELPVQKQSHRTALGRRVAYLNLVDPFGGDLKIVLGHIGQGASVVHHANSLTARVMVNRVWHWHFGAGL
ncbi:MAG: DUF1553 domain-containing protein, partial [Gemmataceae bacterium]